MPQEPEGLGRPKAWPSPGPTRSGEGGPPTWAGVTMALVGLGGLALVVAASLAGWQAGLWVGLAYFVAGEAGVWLVAMHPRQGR